MITAAGKVDLLRNSGESILTAFIRRIYDVELDLTQVQYTISTAADGTKTVILEQRTDGPYYGTTNFSYRGISAAVAGFQEFYFLLTAELPLTIGGLITAIQAKYGILFDLGDLGDSYDTVVARNYGTITLQTRPTSIRFVPQPLRISITPSGVTALPDIIPPTAGNLLTADFGYVTPPVQP